MEVLQVLLLRIGHCLMETLVTFRFALKYSLLPGHLTLSTDRRRNLQRLRRTPKFVGEEKRVLSTRVSQTHQTVSYTEKREDILHFRH